MTEQPTIHGTREFLEHRKTQEEEHRRAVSEHDNVMNSLLALELNITELCNRKCAFCPRVDPSVYPNQNFHMREEVAQKVASDLAAESLRCRISFSGFGEPLLHRDFPRLVKIFRDRLPENTIETNTNGDRLTPERIDDLINAGITYIYVNCYDGPEQVQDFQDRFASAGIDPARYKIRKHWLEADEEGFGLVLNNRSGTVNSQEAGLAPLPEPLQQPCYYPFYKMLVDWNGDVLFCSNDWGRKIVVGNVLHNSIRELWMSDAMFQVRKRLAGGDRSHSPCDRCDIAGMLHGESSFKLLLNHYKNKGAL